MKNKICVGDTVKMWGEEELAVVVRKEKDKEGRIICWLYHGKGDVSTWLIEDLELHQKHIDMRNSFLVRMQELDEYVKDQLGR